MNLQAVGRRPWTGRSRAAVRRRGDLRPLLVPGGRAGASTSSYRGVPLVGTGQAGCSRPAAAAKGCRDAMSPSHNERATANSARSNSPSPRHEEAEATDEARRPQASPPVAAVHHRVPCRTRGHAAARVTLPPAAAHSPNCLAIFVPVSATAATLTVEAMVSTSTATGRAFGQRPGQSRQEAADEFAPPP